MEYNLWSSIWSGANNNNNNSNMRIEDIGRQMYSNSNGGNINTPVHATLLTGNVAPYNNNNNNNNSNVDCRTDQYSSQPEYIAMKPANPVLTSSAQHLLQNTDYRNDIKDEINSLESEVSQVGPSSIASQPTDNLHNAPNAISRKKGKTSKHLKKCVSSSRGEESWTLGGDDTEGAEEGGLPYHQHPVYSMMFNRIPTKRFDELAEESDEDEEEDKKELDINHDPLIYSSETSLPNGSPERGSITSRMGYECGLCNLIAETRPGLKKHISVCHPQESNMSSDIMKKVSVGCPMSLCHFRSTERNEMETHVARHVAEGYSPNGKKRNGPISLQRVRYEREEYRCQMCSYTCTIEKAFYKHLKLHSLGVTVPQIKISCVICGKDRPTEVEMNRHMRKHRDSRYFCCDICIFRTVQLKKLIQHRRMHTGEKPHLCPHCAYRSARRDNLRSHVRRVHKKENLYCDTFSPRGIQIQPSSSPTQL